MSPYVNTHTHHVGEGINVLDVGEGGAWLEDENVRVLAEGQDVFYSVGLHPMKVGQAADEALTVIRETILDERVIAVGECGLDRRSAATMEKQERVLLEQVQLAEKYHKPLIIHCVKAYSELISIRKKSGTSVPWIIHGFNNNEQILAQLLDHGFYISIGAALLNPRSNVFHLICDIPLERLFLENDDREIEIPVIYEAASCLVGLEEERLKERLWENYKKIFNK